MRERVTYIHRDAGFDPDQLVTDEAGIEGPVIKETTRQDRLTVPLDELPPALAALLGDFESLHLRWASPRQYDTLEPFVSRIPPGLHALFRPAKTSSSAEAQKKLCTWLRKFGSVDCEGSNVFTELKREESSSSPAWFFHQQLEDLGNFVASSTEEFCSDEESICSSRTRLIFLTAASLDLSFDATINALQLTAFSPLRPQRVVVPATAGWRTEVGIFVPHTSNTQEDLENGLGGVLTVLGEHKKPSPTVFTFPSRHFEAEGSFVSKFLPPTGLHPTLQLSMKKSQAPTRDAQCAPYAYFTLPKTIFADRYQLADELFLASKNLTGLRYTSLPVDLEAPAYTTETWGSNVLLELAPPSPDNNDPWTVEVPLHLRYLEPSATGQTEVEIPYPAVFWACDGGAERKKNPFEREHLGYDEFFEPSATFWHIRPGLESRSRLTNSVSVPVLREEGAAWIGIGTTIAVALGSVWVLWKLVGAMLPQEKSSSAKAKQDKPKKQ